MEPSDEIGTCFQFSHGAGTDPQNEESPDPTGGKGSKTSNQPGPGLSKLPTAKSATFRAVNTHAKSTPLRGE